MVKVVAGAIGSYDIPVLTDFLERGFQAVGLRLSHCKVLLKPNLVMGKSPRKAVNTHPEFVRAVAGFLLDHSCHVSIGDSPGYESTERALKGSDIMEVARDLDLEVVPFNNTIIKRCEGGISPYRAFTFGEDPSRYDAVVNLPKLKTHGMMGLTLGVKNTFGFIHALEKARWHLRAGRDRMLFASILIDIHRLVMPAVTILDGILGMDGDGPSSGRPRETGIAALSVDAFALDHYIERLVGLRSPLPITQKALDHGLLGKYEVEGDGGRAIRNFEMPETVDTDWAIPWFAKRLLQNIFVKKPKVKAETCKGCAVCRHVCPAGAVEIANDKPHFDYGKCIRCYCCQEMCPEGAITVSYLQ